MASSILFINYFIQKVNAPHKKNGDAEAPPS